MHTIQLKNLWSTCQYQEKVIFFSLTALQFLSFYTCSTTWLFRSFLTNPSKIFCWFSIKVQFDLPVACNTSCSHFHFGFGFAPFDGLPLYSRRMESNETSYSGSLVLKWKTENRSVNDVYLDPPVRKTQCWSECYQLWILSLFNKASLETSILTQIQQ